MKKLVFPNASNKNQDHLFRSLYRARSTIVIFAFF